MRRFVPQRRGITSLLAMLYLVLFATLAIGFYAATNSSVIVVDNEKRGALAMVAAESGMEFIRYQLAQVTIPYGTTQAQLFSTVTTQLSNQLNGTANLTGKTLAVTSTTMSIPSGSDNYINLDSSGGKFRIEMVNLGQKIQVTVIAKGAGGGYTSARGVQLKYDLAEKASQIFNYGVASHGKIATSGKSSIVGATNSADGSLLSTCMTDPNPIDVEGKVVSGDLSVVNPLANVTYGSGTSIGGSTDPSVIAQHIHKGVTAPEFPVVDTDPFLAYVTNVWDGHSKTLTNCRIPANSNPNFTGGANITGVLYIETPNQISFGGNLNVTGCIVVQNNPTGNINTNTISFNGTVNSQGPEFLDPSFGDLRKLTGAFLLAPSFSVSFSGNFGRIDGHIIASKNTFAGNATGEIFGSVVNLDDTLMTVGGSSAITIASTGTTNFPAGVFFSSRYVPLPDTYEEVKP